MGNDGNQAEGRVAETSGPSGARQVMRARAPVPAGPLKRVRLGRPRDCFPNMYETFPVGLAALDADGTIRSINRAGAELLGEAPEALSGRELTALFSPHLRESAGAQVRELLQASTSAPATLDLDLPDGRVLRVISARREDDAGEPQYLASLLDVTDQRESVRRARQSDALRQSVLDSLSAQIAVLDETGRILTVNRAWRRFAEENGADAELGSGVGLNYFEISASSGEAASDGDASINGIRGVIEGRLPVFTMEYPCPSARDDRWFMLTATPLAGEARGAVVAHTDISRRHALEQQERRRREVMAQSARLHAVGILASSLVHELTQPLSAATFYIGAALSMAKEGGSEGDLSEVLLGVDAQIRRAGEIVHRLREFMRRRETNLGVVLLEEVIGQAMEFVNSLAADRKVHLVLEPGAPGPAVKADPMQVEQVIVNLLCNAIQAVDTKASKPREVRVAVGSRPGAAVVTVSDTGPGVPPERVERIFDVFETDKPGGMGMGLPISREIVEAHGGKLWAEADAKGGAVFRFTLPIHPEDNA